MEVVVTKHNLLAALQLLQRVSGVSRELPALSAVNMTTHQHRLQLSATDLEVGLVTAIGAKVVTQGSLAVPIRLLLDFVSLLRDETVTLRVDGTTLSINSQSSSVTIRGLESSEFPAIPTIEQGKTATVSGELLATALQTVLTAAATDSSRPVLQSIACLGGKELKLVATDSFRLGEVTIPVTWNVPSLILPIRAAHELIKLARLGDEITMRTEQGQVEFSTAETRLFSRTLDGNYPDYTKIVPTEVPAVVEVNRSQLVSAIKLAGVVTRTENQAVELNYHDGQLQVSGTSHLLGQGSSTLTAALHGTAIDLAATFNAKYLLDGLLPQSEELVQLGLVAPDRPLVLRAQLGGKLPFLYLIMPLQQPAAAPVSAAAAAAAE